MLAQDLSRDWLHALSRRGLLSAAAAAFAGCSLQGRLSPRETLVTDQVPPGPFTLGVASGDPTADGVVLWTRLAPRPLEDGGMPPAAVAVRWEVAEDERMKRVVRRGVTLARPELAHAVHVEVSGLAPGRWYWYRFHAGREVSPVGRTRTAPDGPAERVAFAVASCQSWTAGHFTAYEHMVREDLDLVVHLGDYIYEGGDPGGAQRVIRRHGGPEIYTLDDYRRRHALYKTDPWLQAAHAAFPWAVTWDDHEVDNNYSGPISERNDDPRLFLLRRAAAYQAYYEHMPLRLTSRPTGPDMLLYRRLAFGDLLSLNVLDTRQYRSGAPGTLGPRPVEPPDREAPSLIGPRQEAWLVDGLTRSRARWNAIAQGVFVGQRDLTLRETGQPTPPGGEPVVSLDAWDGYPRARERLLRVLEERRPPNPIVLTGDVHANWVADLKARFDDPASATLGAEFVGTSITSGGDGGEVHEPSQKVLATNPHVRFNNNQRGYVRCLISPRRWQTDFRVVPYVTRPGAPIATCASFVVEDGRPGATRAG